MGALGATLVWFRDWSHKGARAHARESREQPPHAGYGSAQLPVLLAHATVAITPRWPLRPSLPPARSTWVTINTATRRLSKLPEDVRKRFLRFAPPSSV